MSEAIDPKGKLRGVESHPSRKNKDAARVGTQPGSMRIKKSVGPEAHTTAGLESGAPGAFN